MELITQKEAYKIMKKDKEEISKIIDNGGKIIDTIIYEKDKVTTIKRIEPVNSKPTSSKVIQTKECITLQIQGGA